MSPGSHIEFKSATSCEKDDHHTRAYKQSTARNYGTQSSPLSWNTAPFWGILAEEAATW